MRLELLLDSQLLCNLLLGCGFDGLWPFRGKVMKVIVSKFCLPSNWSSWSQCLCFCSAHLTMRTDSKVSKPGESTPTLSLFLKSKCSKLSKLGRLYASWSFRLATCRHPITSGDPVLIWVFPETLHTV